MTARGRIIHRLLAEVEWIETFDRSDEELMAIGRKIGADEHTIASALSEFRAALAQPNTRGVLSRPKGIVEVWRERRFSMVRRSPDRKTEIWSGTFDRVVIRREGGCAVSATVIDFKTDRGGATDPDRRDATYDAQLSNYLRALRAITGFREKEMDAFLLYLLQDTLVSSKTAACSRE
jgi:ATP-dependent exoDNAse (exonuclease V) beta subunit